MELHDGLAASSAGTSGATDFEMGGPLTPPVRIWLPLRRLPDGPRTTTTLRLAPALNADYHKVTGPKLSFVW